MKSNREDGIEIKYELESEHRLPRTLSEVLMKGIKVNVHVYLQLTCKNFHYIFETYSILSER